MSQPIFLRRAASLLVSLLFVGCGSKQQFYRLSAEDSAATRGGGSAISLGVGPISLPNYIDRSELVFQSGPNEFQIPPNVSWTGSLQANIASVLASELQRELGAREILTYPWPSGRAPQRRVALDIRQFHGISGSGAILDATWRIEDSNGATISRGSGVFREPINGDGYGPVVAAESRLVAQCAVEIARSLR
ncbi:MAG TPA: PqiC family protein [Chthoniobacterales bacterium]